MRRIIALALLAAPLLAEAIPPGWMRRPNPASLSAPFSTSGCVASGSAAGSKGEAITVIRASVAENTIQGTPSSCAANQARVNESGLLVEPQRQNIVTAPDAPTTETPTLGVLTNIYAWLEGTGSMAITAGTAVTTGLPCTVTASSPCVFSVTTGGTVTWTKTGTVSFFQAEPGAYNPGFKTSKIHTTGYRVAEQISIVNPTTGPQCFAGSFGPEFGRTWQSFPFNLWTTTAAVGGANSARVFISSGVAYFDTYDASAVNKRLSYSIAGWADGTTHKIAACIDSGCAPSLWIDGMRVTGTITGTGSCTTLGTPIYLGAVGDGSYAFGGFISGFKVLKSSNGALASSVFLQPLQITCFGDSLTAYGSPPYCTSLATALGPTYKGTAYGYPGEYTDLLLPQWYSIALPTAAGSVVIWQGTNDLTQGHSGTSGATTIANLRQQYDSARGVGMRLVAATILPFKGLAAWDSGKEADRQTINAWIKAEGTAKGFQVVDAATFFDDGTGALKAGYDSGDHEHLNQAGYDYMGSTLLRAAFP